MKKRLQVSRKNVNKTRFFFTSSGCSFASDVPWKMQLSSTGFLHHCEAFNRRSSKFLKIGGKMRSAGGGGGGGGIISVGGIFWYRCASQSFLNPPQS